MVFTKQLTIDAQETVTITGTNFVSVPQVQFQLQVLYQYQQ